MVLFGAIVVIGFGIIFYLQTNDKPMAPKTEQQVSTLVQIISAKLGSYHPTQQLYGKINTERLVKILAHDNGEVEKVFVSSGDLIATGETLVSLDEQDFLTDKATRFAQLQQTELEIEQAKIDINSLSQLLAYERSLLDLNKKRLERIRQLARKKNVSITELEKAQETYIKRQSAVVVQKKQQQDARLLLQRLQHRLKSEQAQLTQSSRRLQRVLTKSPTDGLVTQVTVQKGSRVSANSALLEILPVENLEINAVLINHQLPMILDALQNNVPLHASINAFGVRLPATLVRLQGRANNGTTLGVFALETPNPKLLQRLRPHLLLPVLLELPKVANSMIVPYSALYGSNKVYVVNDGRLHATEISLLGSITGIDEEKWALIHSENIANGDPILTTYLPNATHHLPVTIQWRLSSKAIQHGKKKPDFR